MTRPRLVRAPKIDPRSDEELLRRSQKFYEAMQRRRTIRDFSDRPVPREVIEYCIRVAGTAPIGTDSRKPFLVTAPWLIAVFAQPFRILADGTRSPTYYAIESVGIATGI